MNIRYSLIMLLALLMIACEKNIELPSDSYPISLSADVVSVNNTSRSGADGQTRSVAYTGTSAADMTAGVWFSTTIGKYPATTTPQPPTFLPYHTTVTYASGAPATVYVDPANKNNPLSYPLPDNTNPNKALDVYCVGLYPATGWSAPSEGVATYFVDGNDDVMFAEQIKGSWGEPFTSQHYEHLLMWLKFESRVTDEKAIEQWGNITKISVLNANDTVKVTFPTTDGGTSSFEYNIDSNSKEDELVALQGSFPLTVTAQSMGELLCIPSTSVKLRIETDKSIKKDIIVPLYDEQGAVITDYKKTIGRLFIINLYFNKFNNIDAACSLIPWNEQNVDINGN